MGNVAVAEELLGAEELDERAEAALRFRTRSAASAPDRDPVVFAWPGPSVLWCGRTRLTWSAVCVTHPS